MPIMYFVRQIYPHDIPPPFGNSVFRVGLGSLLEFQVEGQLARAGLAIDLFLAPQLAKNYRVGKLPFCTHTTQIQTQALVIHHFVLRVNPELECQ